MKTPTKELVRQLRYEGMSLRKIYLALKERGYLSASGKPLSTSTIYLWLRGEDPTVLASETSRLIKQVLASDSFSPEQKNRIIQAMVS